MNIKKELEENQTVLIIIPSAKYNEVVNYVAKQLSNGTLCYVTLNKTYNALDSGFKKKGVNLKNIIYIDGISKTIKTTPKETDRSYFVTNPGALTELSLVITKFLRHNFDYLIFDSFTNLMTYQKHGPITKFIMHLINKVKSSKTKSVFYVLKIKDHESMIKQCGMAVDKVIDWEEDVSNKVVKKKVVKK